MNTFTDWRRIASVLLAAFALTPAFASGPSSLNYEIVWDVVDGGGGTAASASYNLEDSVAQPTATGTSTSVSYVITAGFHTLTDADEDGYKNRFDNCIFEPNADQRDTNSDGFGNICDPDLNNDGVINPVDLGLLRSRFFTADPDADFDGNGVVNAVDLGILKIRFFSVPGPSGIN